MSLSDKIRVDTFETESWVVIKDVKEAVKELKDFIFNTRDDEVSGYGETLIFNKIKEIFGDELSSQLKPKESPNG